MKIGIAGSHSTGKTTLMQMLKKDFPSLNLVSEAARDCPFPINEKTGFQSQEWIFREQVKRELAAPIDDITISDRTVYDQLAYVMYAFENGNITYEELRLLEKYISYWGFTYDYIVYIPIEFDLVKDGIRSESEDYRVRIDQYIQKFLEEYVPADKIAVIKGTPEERVKQLKDLMLELSEKTKV